MQISKNTENLIEVKLCSFEVKQWRCLLIAGGRDATTFRVFAMLFLGLSPGSVRIENY
jgi:hypothetical protein